MRFQRPVNPHALAREGKHSRFAVLAVCAAAVLAWSAGSVDVTYADKAKDGAQKKQVWHTMARDAVAESKQTGKPILAVFNGSDWCPYCIKLSKEVFSQTEFTRWAQDSVVILYMDFPRRKQLSREQVTHNRAMMQRYQVPGFPSVLFLDSQGKPYGATGYIPGGAKRWVENADRYLARIPKAKPQDQNKDKDKDQDNGKAPGKEEPTTKAPASDTTPSPAAPATLSNIAKAMAQAKKQGKPLLVVASPGTIEAADDRVAKALADPAVKKLASDRLVVVYIKEKDKATPKQQVKALKDLRAKFEIKRRLVQYLLFDSAVTETLGRVETPVSGKTLHLQLRRALDRLDGSAPDGKEAAENGNSKAKKVS